MGQQCANNVIADLIRNLEGRRRVHATLSTCWLRPWRKLVLASRQYPQSGVRVLTSQPNRQNPLFLDGRGIKGEGETIQNNHQYPLSLDGRGPKPVPVPDTGAEGENDAPHRHVIADLIRNPEVRGWADNKPTQPYPPLP